MSMLQFAFFRVLGVVVDSGALEAVECRVCGMVDGQGHRMVRGCPSGPRGSEVNFEAGRSSTGDSRAIAG